MTVSNFPFWQNERFRSDPALKRGKNCTNRIAGKFAAKVQMVRQLAGLPYHAWWQVLGHRSVPEDRFAVSECRLPVQNKINGLTRRRDTFASAIRSPPKTSIKPVYWNGTHPSVFEFRVENERDDDFDAAGASV